MFEPNCRECGRGYVPVDTEKPEPYCTLECAYSAVTRERDEWREVLEWCVGCDANGSRIRRDAFRRAALAAKEK